MSLALSGGVTGASSGAASGAAVGGPWGAVIGGVIGGIAGFMGGNSADKAAKDQRRAIRRAYREKWRQATLQYHQVTGVQRVGYAAANVDVTRGTPGELTAMVDTEFTRYQAELRQQEKAALKGATPSTNFWQLAGSVASSAASIYGSSSDWGSSKSPYSQSGGKANVAINGGPNMGERLA
jgi:hypothetical protein